MKNFARLLSALLIGITLAWGVVSCTDPTKVGAELLADDRIDVGFNDTLNLEVNNFYGDSLLVYTPASFISRYLLGDYNDPVFGQVSADVYSAIRMPRTAAGVVDKPDFSSSIPPDSLILVLPLNEPGSYGAFSSPITIEVYQLLDTIGSNSNHYSNETFPTGALIGSTTLVPDFDTTRIIDYLASPSGDTVLSIANLRIPLSFMTATMFRDADTTVYENDSTLLEFFPGFQIKVSGMSNGLLGLDLLGSAALHYYNSTGTDNDSYQYFWPLTTRVNHYEHTYAGSIVDNFINGPQPSDSLIFIQGMEGVLADLKFMDLEPLRDKIINQAQLEFTVIELPGGGSSTYGPPVQLILLEENEDGDRVIIADAAFSQAIDNNSFLFFGGDLEEDGTGKQTYTMNVTLQLTDILAGERENKMTLAVFQRAGDPRRVVLAGPGHPEFPIQLRVAFTEL